MLNVYLLRHGQTPWNADGNRYCGRTDVPLTEKGLAQAARVREQLRSVVLDALYSSPLQRAYETARIAGGGRDVIKDPRLIEADFGQWEGKTKEEFVSENPALWQSWITNPAGSKAGGTGETGMDIVGRVDDFFAEARRRHRDSNILVVGHNGINRLYLAHKLGMHLKDYQMIVQENSSITLFSLDDDGRISLKMLNSRGVE